MKLPERKDLVAEAIYATYKKGEHRAHLGASQIGTECERSLWYTFFWCTAVQHEPRILRLFESGHLSETRVLDELRRAGFEVFDKEVGTGKQFSFSACNGHFGGSLDGFIKGVPDAEKTVHVLELKTSNDKNFRTLEKDGVLKAHPVHYAQMMCYMGAFGLERALYISVNKNTDEIYSERVHFEKSVYNALLEKALRVIESKKPSPKISEDPSWYQCKLCDHAGVCQNHQNPEKNCRTCEFSQIGGNGTWFCGKTDQILSFEEQLKGCQKYQLKILLDDIPF